MGELISGIDFTTKRMPPRRALPQNHERKPHLNQYVIGRVLDNFYIRRHTVTAIRRDLNVGSNAVEAIIRDNSRRVDDGPAVALRKAA